MVLFCGRDRRTDVRALLISSALFKRALCAAAAIVISLAPLANAFASETITYTYDARGAWSLSIMAPLGRMPAFPRATATTKAIIAAT